MSDVLRERINDAWDDVFEAIQERTIKRSVGDRFLGRIAAIRSAVDTAQPQDHAAVCLAPLADGYTEPHHHYPDVCSDHATFSLSFHVAESPVTPDLRDALQHALEEPCTCRPFFAGHVVAHPNCPRGRQEAAALASPDPGVPLPEWMRRNHAAVQVPIRRDSDSGAER